MKILTDKSIILEDMDRLIKAAKGLEAKEITLDAIGLLEAIKQGIDELPTVIIEPLENDGEHKVTQMNLYDVEEVHENCTVQILKNTMTGERSMGWWKNETD